MVSNSPSQYQPQTSNSQPPGQMAGVCRGMLMFLFDQTLFLLLSLLETDKGYMRYHITHF